MPKNPNDIYDIIQDWCVRAAKIVTKEQIRIIKKQKEPSDPHGSDEIDEYGYTLEKIMDVYKQAKIGKEE